MKNIIFLFLIVLIPEIVNGKGKPILPWYVYVLVDAACLYQMDQEITIEEVSQYKEIKWSATETYGNREWGGYWIGRGQATIKNDNDFTWTTAKFKMGFYTDQTKSHEIWSEYRLISDLKPGKTEFWDTQEIMLAVNGENIEPKWGEVELTAYAQADPLIIHHYSDKYGTIVNILAVSTLMLLYEIGARHYLEVPKYLTLNVNPEKVELTLSKSF